MITNLTREVARLQKGFQKRIQEQPNSPSVRSRTSQAAFHESKEEENADKVFLTSFIIDGGIDMEIKGQTKDTPEKTIPLVSSSTSLNTPEV